MDRGRLCYEGPKLSRSQPLDKDQFSPKFAGEGLSLMMGPGPSLKFSDHIIYIKL